MPLLDLLSEPKYSDQVWWRGRARGGPRVRAEAVSRRVLPPVLQYWFYVLITPVNRVWAKKLRAEVLAMYPALRSVECDMEEVRAVGKRRIDRMYYLDMEQSQR